MADFQCNGIVIAIFLVFLVVVIVGVTVAGVVACRNINVNAASFALHACMCRQIQIYINLCGDDKIAQQQYQQQQAPIDFNVRPQHSL